MITRIVGVWFFIGALAATYFGVSIFTASESVMGELLGALFFVLAATLFVVSILCVICTKVFQVSEEISDRLVELTTQVKKSAPAPPPASRDDEIIAQLQGLRAELKWQREQKMKETRVK